MQKWKISKDKYMIKQLIDSTYKLGSIVSIVNDMSHLWWLRQIVVKATTRARVMQSFKSRFHMI